ncbi:unnamed protein product [[Actinomadura] parvosata subsp. kistnae]|uniref:Uncharacterized protein n=1 Tax=[Actinomadura] parvosata subsp. kistnae TaxID=1909395 RepID=A0A1U9ZUK5_9ACTN|nr:hypothetical protein BKM31_09235 [Nonomuraea sp. ATCC 55076]SPL87724.1 unnamed protein product [Actinomadura parvosata subsp. kistnae]
MGRVRSRHAARSVRHWPALPQAHRPPGWIAWWTPGTDGSSCDEPCVAVVMAVVSGAAPRPRR